jgi:hypothetical protein
MHATISETALTKDMKENGRTFVEKNFSIDRMLDWLDALYARRLHL